MKKLITLLYLITLLSSCSVNENYEQLIEGQWSYKKDDFGCQIIFNKGVYVKTNWNDDLVRSSEGSYFFNQNPKRRAMTLILIPDIQYSQGDTIILPSENIDIVRLTDSFLIRKMPSQWVHNFDKGKRIKNETEIYIKSQDVSTND